MYLILCHNGAVVSAPGAMFPRQPGTNSGIFTRSVPEAAVFFTRGQAMAAARRMVFLRGVPYSVVKCGNAIPAGVRG